MGVGVIRSVVVVPINFADGGEQDAEGLAAVVVDGDSVGFAG